MTHVKFAANAFQVGVENNQVVLEAAVLSPCGKVHQSVDIYLPLSFKNQFTDLIERAKKGEDSGKIFRFQRGHIYNN